MTTIERRDLMQWITKMLVTLKGEDKRVFEVLVQEAWQSLQENKESSPKYTWEQLTHRVNEMNKGGLVLSNQYGMIFILNQQGEILLSLSSLMDEAEREKYS